MTTDAKKRLLADVPGLTEDLLRFAKKEWTKTNVMRQILNAEAEFLIDTARTGLESVEPEDLKELQGRIAGIREMLAAINAMGDA